MAGFERPLTLSYSRNRGTQIFYCTLGGVADNNLMRPVIHTLDGQTYEFPAEAVEVGAIELTGTISTYMATHWLINSICGTDSDRLPGLFVSPCSIRNFARCRVTLPRR